MSHEFSPNDTFQLQMPASVKMKRGIFLGRICGKKGCIYYVMSPHGTTVRAGFAFVERLSTEQLYKLRLFEMMVMDGGKCVEPYPGAPWHNNQYGEGPGGEG